MPPAAFWRINWGGRACYCRLCSGKKTADMMRADDLSLWEIKTNHSGNAKTISRALQDAKTQSCNAIVHIVAAVCDMKAIERAAALRKRFSALENVILIRGDQLVFV